MTQSANLATLASSVTSSGGMGNVSIGNLSITTSVTSSANVIAPGINANSFVTVDSLNGITLNYTSRRVNKICETFVFEEEAGILSPLGKTKVTFSATGAQQTWAVPAGVTYIYVKMWGAGGAGGSSGGWSYGSPGGGGGHSRGLIPVTAGNTLYLVVGVGGQTNYAGTTTPMYGGGGGLATNSDNRYAGSGGGMAGIFTGSTPSQSNALIIAGGGGGGGGSRAGWGNYGGAGGGNVGQQGGSPYDNKSAYGGFGGSQSGGGTAGTGSNSGSAMVGGTGGQGTSNPYGGAGGGGYYGGGGGGYSESNTMAGGGGGSGYINTGAGILLYGTYTGSQQHPAFYHDNDLPKTTDTYQNSQRFGYGGDLIQSGSQYTSIYGGGGYIVIYY